MLKLKLLILCLTDNPVRVNGRAVPNASGRGRNGAHHHIQVPQLPERGASGSGTALRQRQENDHVSTPTQKEPVR